MNRRVVEAPPAQITLLAHPPAPARVELTFLPLEWRLTCTLLSLLVCWGAIPLARTVPPHYPWVLALFSAGAVLAHYFWTKRYRVRSFSGRCPRCGEELGLRVGTHISLPYTFTCHGCYHEPLLEVRFTAPPPPVLAHRVEECSGEWRREVEAEGVMLVCARCRARCPATPASVRAADTENRYGQLLAQLTTEGRSLL